MSLPAELEWAGTDSGVLWLLGVDGMLQACVLQRLLILESPRMHDKNIDCGIPLEIYARRSEGQLKASDFINVSGVAKQNWERVKERDSGGHLCSERPAGRFSGDWGPADHTLCCKSWAGPSQGTNLIG